MSKPKILVLYSEIMPYNVVCFKDFVKTTGGEIKVICWDEKKKLTPYIPIDSEKIIYESHSNYTLDRLKILIDNFRPNAILVSGRMDNNYLAASLYARKQKIPVIGLSDNQYSGNLKQKISMMFSAILWKRYFDYVMVPGLYQYEYVRYLGFKKEQILFSLYCADTEIFNDFYVSKKEKVSKIKKYILFVGRLSEIKGLDVLIETFCELKSEKKLDLDLMIIGNGLLANIIPERNDIIRFPFMSQEELIKHLPEVKFFCLPSRKEPWGLVIHEFASAGMPIITTAVCGSSTAFVKNGYNGYIINSCDKKLLKNAILKMNSLSNDEIEQFSERSYNLSKQIAPELWTASVTSILT